MNPGNLGHIGRHIDAIQHIRLAEWAVSRAISGGARVPSQRGRAVRYRVNMGLDEITLGKKGQRQKNDDDFTPTLSLRSNHCWHCPLNDQANRLSLIALTDQVNGWRFSWIADRLSLSQILPGISLDIAAIRYRGPLGSASFLPRKNNCSQLHWGLSFHRKNPRSFTQAIWLANSPGRKPDCFFHRALLTCIAWGYALNSCGL
jgi:hypothetical protein